MILVLRVPMAVERCGSVMAMEQVSPAEIKAI